MQKHHFEKFFGEKEKVPQKKYYVSKMSSFLEMSLLKFVFLDCYSFLPVFYHKFKVAFLQKNSIQFEMFLFHKTKKTSLFSLFFNFSSNETLSLIRGEISICQMIFPLRFRFQKEGISDDWFLLLEKIKRAPSNQTEYFWREKAQDIFGSEIFT